MFVDPKTCKYVVKSVDTKNTSTGQTSKSFKLDVNNAVTVDKLPGHHHVSNGTFNGAVCFGTCGL